MYPREMTDAEFYTLTVTIRYAIINIFKINILFFTILSSISLSEWAYES